MQVGGIPVEQLLGDARVLKMERFGGGHGGTEDENGKNEKAFCGRQCSRGGRRRSSAPNHVAAFSTRTARNRAATSRRASGRMLVPASTGMKFVSPFQRGTT